MRLNLRIKIKNVKIVLTDVDGTLTDGGMYYSSKGDAMKKFYVRDGMAVNILRRNGIFTVLVTKEKSDDLLILLLMGLSSRRVTTISFS